MFCELRCRRLRRRAVRGFLLSVLLRHVVSEQLLDRGLTTKDCRVWLACKQHLKRFALKQSFRKCAAHSEDFLVPLLLPDIGVLPCRPPTCRHRNLYFMSLHVLILSPSCALLQVPELTVVQTPSEKLTRAVFVHVVSVMFIAQGSVGPWRLFLEGAGSPKLNKVCHAR